LTNVTPDLFLIDMGVNDIGRGRNPYFVATNDMAALLDMIFAKVPAANIIIGQADHQLGSQSRASQRPSEGEPET